MHGMTEEDIKPKRRQHREDRYREEISQTEEMPKTDSPENQMDTKDTEQKVEKEKNDKPKKRKSRKDKKLKAITNDAGPSVSVDIKEIVNSDPVVPDPGQRLAFIPETPEQLDKAISINIEPARSIFEEAIPPKISLT